MKFKLLLVSLFLSLCAYGQTTGPGTTGGGVALSTNIQAPTNNQGLCYQTSTGFWINGTCAGGTASSVPASGVTAGALGTSVTLTNLSQLPTQNPGTIVGVPAGGSLAAPSALSRNMYNAADYGVKCDGATDDTTNLQAFFTALTNSGGGQGQINAGTCLFSSTLSLPINFRNLLGAGQYATKLVYTGASTGIDFIQVEGSSASSSIGQAIFGGFSISSHTQMQGGSAIHVKWLGALTIRDVNLADQNCSAYSTNCDWLWNGISDESTGLLFIDNYNIQTQNDCIQVFGVGAGGTGPQYDTYIGMGKVAGCKGASGAASSGSTTTIVDTNQKWITNNYVGQTVSVVVGGTTYTATITANTSNTLTFAAIGAAVVATNPYAVIGNIGAGLHIGGGWDNIQITGGATMAQNGINILDDNALVGIGNATGGSTTTLIDTAKNWRVNDYVGLVLTVTISATPYTATVTANTSNTMTFSAIGAAVTAASPYSIAGFGSAKNQRITVGPDVIVDSATGADNIYINDPFANYNNWDDIRISGQITGSKRGNGINVYSYPSGYIHIGNSMIQANTLSGVYGNDVTTHIFADGATNILYNSRYGIESSAPDPFITSLAYISNNSLGLAYSPSGPGSLTIGGISTAATGNYNTSLGYNSMGSVNNAATSANANVCMGYECLYALSTGVNNVAIGEQAGMAINSGGRNTLLGVGTGNALNSGGGNTFLGGQVGQTTTTGGSNVVIGTNSSCVTTGAGTSNEIDICAGNAAASIKVTGANTPSTSVTTVSGAFSTNTVPIANLPTCSSTSVGQYLSVNNGVASPTYFGAVSTTGTATDPVYCNYNGTAYSWVYH